MKNIIDQHPRRIARESVMQVLYAEELNDNSPEDILDLYAKSYNSPEDIDYMRQLFFCVIENKTWADELICQCLENWKYERVAVVDKILLRNLKPLDITKLKVPMILLLKKLILVIQMELS